MTQSPDLYTSCRGPQQLLESNIRPVPDPYHHMWCRLRVHSSGVACNDEELTLEVNVMLSACVCICCTTWMAHAHTQSITRGPLQYLCVRVRLCGFMHSKELNYHTLTSDTSILRSSQLNLRCNKVQPSAICHASSKRSVWLDTVVHAAQICVF